MTTRVLIVDDHAVVRQGVRSLLSNHADLEVVGEAASAAEAHASYRSLRPDVVLLDIRLVGGSGLEVLDDLLELDPDARVLMLSSFDDEEYVMRSLRTGAYGYLLKGDSDAVLVTAIQAVASGRRSLSPQVTDQILEQLFGRSEPARPTFDEVEVRILRLVSDGGSNVDIASELYVSETTVKRRLRQVFAKLGVSSRTEAAAEAARRGLI
jgi:DNA-binding NarL/FixJ family response regulator